MEQDYNIYKIVAEEVDETRDLVERVVRSQFQLLHDTMETATVDNAPPIHFQYLGTWQSNPYHLAKLKQKKLKNKENTTEE